MHPLPLVMECGIIESTVKNKLFAKSEKLKQLVEKVDSISS